MAPGKEPPSKPNEPADIESQLDDLLDQIAKAEPNLLAQDAPAASQSPPATAAEEVTAADPLVDDTAVAAQDTGDDTAPAELTPEAIEDQLAAVAQVLGKTPAEVSKPAKTVPAPQQTTPPANQEQAMDDLLAAVTAAAKDMPAAAPAKPVPMPAPVEPEAVTPEVDDEPVVAATHVAASHVDEPAAADADETPADAEPAGDALGLDLASQIQQLLDDARTQEADGSSSTAEDDARQDAELDAAAASKAVAAAPPVASEDGAMNIDAIDQMLADGADEAVVGDFETINEVLATDTTPEAAAEPAPAATSPVAASPAAAAGVSDGAGAEGQPAGAVEEEEEIDGSFETPSEILTAAPDQVATEPVTVDASALSADAQAVGKELDEQPELKAGKQARGNTAAKGDPAAVAADSKPLKISGLVAKLPAILAAIKGLPGAVQQVCMMINRPLLGLSPQARDMVGYAGLITVFWGSVTIVGKFVFAMMG